MPETRFRDERRPRGTLVPRGLFRPSLLLQDPVQRALRRFQEVPPQFVIGGPPPVGDDLIVRLGSLEELPLLVDVLSELSASLQVFPRFLERHRNDVLLRGDFLLPGETPLPVLGAVTLCAL